MLFHDFKKITVLVADDHPIYRRGVVEALAAISYVHEVFEVDTAADAVRCVLSRKPDVAFLDLGMSGSGLEALKKIVASKELTRCVILTACEDAKTAIEALNAGARGYILKDISGDELVSALLSIVENKTFVSPAFVTHLLQAAVSPTSSACDSSQLSAREVQIMEHLRDGRTNREIASRLNLSDKTVKFYMSSILQKLGVKNRVAALVAFQKERENWP